MMEGREALAQYMDSEERKRQPWKWTASLSNTCSCCSYQALTLSLDAIQGC